MGRQFWQEKQPEACKVSGRIWQKVLRSVMVPHSKNFFETSSHGETHGGLSSGNGTERE